MSYLFVLSNFCRDTLDYGVNAKRVPQYPHSHTETYIPPPILQLQTADFNQHGQTISNMTEPHKIIKRKNGK